MHKTLTDLQSSFTGFLRDPSGTPMPEGLMPERMRVYQDLVFRNVQNLLTSNFPVLAKITGDKSDWDALARGFIRDHRAHTPHFPLLATEFLDYLEGLSDNSDKPEAQILFRYPFAKELAHYEWVELDVQIALEPNLPGGSQQITLRDGLSINPTAHVLAYEWPVHLIGPDFQPTEAPDAPTFIAVFQNVNAQSEFILLTPLAALLLENIEQRATCSTAEHIRILAQQHEDLSEADLSESVLEIADQFRKQGLITGETISSTP
jgi:hypothetical protein